MSDAADQSKKKPSADRTHTTRACASKPEAQLRIPFHPFRLKPHGRKGINTLALLLHSAHFAVASMIRLPYPQSAKADSQFMTIFFRRMRMDAFFIHFGCYTGLIR